MRQYRKQRKAYLGDNPICQVKGCDHYATEIHHKKGRSGDMLLDEEFWMAICHDHHRYITDHPTWAKENGYELSRLT